MPATKQSLLIKLCEIENALNNYSSDALFLAIHNLRTDDVLVKDLEQISHLLTNCQDRVNKVIDDLKGADDE